MEGRLVGEALAGSPTGAGTAGRHADATVVVRDLRGGPFLLSNAAKAIALSPDGRLAICSDNDITVLHREEH